MLNWLQSRLPRLLRHMRNRPNIFSIEIPIKDKFFQEQSCGFPRDRREFFAKLGGVGKIITIFILNLAPSQDTNDQNGINCSITEGLRNRAKERRPGSRDPELLGGEGEPYPITHFSHGGQAKKTHLKSYQGREAF
ncbi:hypothetical protein KY290_025759 [Solanum tuberosum]|uniref:Uncharacterized protein n=1 Tax=Solanum tuberosum TaxID=4113 RepID=A0ABQ7UUH1_SOLTU|nr:hypothetical protein KY289_025899 [Solanum tuberosum]KAH0676800.1 hypothetical protein KY285_024601 [Solanum tuberosum]KAH0755489.1 hypothetical protein KY290_025759 [Solanum tuberosum]